MWHRTGDRSGSHPTAELSLTAYPHLPFSHTKPQLNCHWKPWGKKGALQTNNNKKAKLHYFSCTLITLWTIGMSLPSTLKTTISPALIGSSWKFVRNSRSPLWKAGSMLPLQRTKKERVCWHKWKKHREIQEHLILTDKPTIRTEICSFTHSVTLLKPLTDPRSQKAICRNLPIKWRNLDFKKSHTFTAPTNLCGNWAMATDTVTFARAQTELEESVLVFF